MIKRCDKCGMELVIVRGKYFCSNHGFVDEESEESDLSAGDIR